MTAYILERLAALPCKLAADSRRCFVEATAADLVAICRIHRDTRSAALDAASAWIEAKGGVSFFMPHEWGTADSRPTVFIFATPPNPREFKLLRGRWDTKGRGNAYAPTKWKEGKAIQAEIDALPGLPNSSRITRLVGAPDRIPYTTTRTEWGDGQISVGREGSHIWGSGFAYAGERYFVYFPNPFYDIARIASDAESYPDPVVPDSLLEWRPPAGWELRSKVEIDLIYAQHNADVEAKKAA